MARNKHQRILFQGIVTGNPWLLPETKGPNPCKSCKPMLAKRDPETPCSIHLCLRVPNKGQNGSQASHATGFPTSPLDVSNIGCENSRKDRKVLLQYWYSKVLSYLCTYINLYIYFFECYCGLQICENDFKTTLKVDSRLSWPWKPVKTYQAHPAKRNRKTTGLNVNETACSFSMLAKRGTITQMFIVRPITNRGCFIRHQLHSHKMSWLSQPKLYTVRNILGWGNTLRLDDPAIKHDVGKPVYLPVIKHGNGKSPVNMLEWQKHI